MVTHPNCRREETKGALNPTAKSLKDHLCLFYMQNNTFILLKFCLNMHPFPAPVCSIPSYSLGCQMLTWNTGLGL